MTEAEWQTCTDPQPMLEFLRGKASERKLRLFAVACCRRIWRFLPDRRSRKAVEVAERYADGKADEDSLRSVCEDAVEADDTGRGADAAAHASDIPVDAKYVAFEAAWATRDTDDAPPTAECRAQAELLRDTFGNPFRPVTIDPSWLAWSGGTVFKLAQNIYDERAFDRLPVLADALEEAGCDSGDILAHCRQPGQHLRGCWVVDLVLQKE